MHWNFSATTTRHSPESKTSAIKLFNNVRIKVWLNTKITIKITKPLHVMIVGYSNLDNGLKFEPSEYDYEN